MYPSSETTAAFYGLDQPVTGPLIKSNYTVARTGRYPNIVLRDVAETHPQTFEMPYVEYDNVQYVSVADPHRIKPQPRTDAEKWMDTLAIPAPAHRDVHVLQGSHLSPNPRAVEFLADGYVQRLHPDPTGLVYSLHGGHLGKRRLKNFMYQFEGGELRHAGADNYLAVPGRIPLADVNVADLVTNPPSFPTKQLEQLVVPVAPPVIHFDTL
jgi:hypothetical protein